MHALAEIDGVEYLDLILSDGLQGIATFNQDTAFGIRHDIGAVHLEQVRLQPEPGLTRAGAAYDQDILVSGIGWILGPVAHGQTLRCRQDHVVLELGIHERLDIRMSAP